VPSMATMKIYGTAGRAKRALWAAEEAGVQVETVEIPLRPGEGIYPDGPESAKAEFIEKINPFGAIPVLQDGDMMLRESMAINMYLAKKGGGMFAPQTLEEDAQCQQWSLWCVSACEQAALAIMFASVAGEESPPEHVASLTKALSGLDAALVSAGSGFLVGERFTVADLNVASVLNWAKRGNFDISQFDAVSAWLDACTSRATAKL